MPMDKKVSRVENYTLEIAVNNSKNRYAYLAVNAGAPYHTHEDFFEIFYVVSGEMQHTKDGETERLSTGDAYLIRPGDCHMMVPLRAAGVRYSHRDIYISVKDMQEICRFAAPENDLYADIVSAPAPLRFYLTYHDVRSIEAQAIRLSTSPEPRAAQCYRATVLNLLNLCVTDRSSLHYPQWLNKLLAFIHSSVARKRSLEEYVTSTGYCHEHVSREFKRHTGYRLNEYILRTKLEYAKTLLALEDGNGVTDIAYYLGFSSESNFIAAFKKLYGITPLQWKKQVRVREEP